MEFLEVLRALKATMIQTYETILKKHSFPKGRIESIEPHIIHSTSTPCNLSEFTFPTPSFCWDYIASKTITQMISETPKNSIDSPIFVAAVSLLAGPELC